LFEFAKSFEILLQLLADFVLFFDVQVWPSFFQSDPFYKLQVDKCFSLISTPAVHFRDRHTGK